MHLEETRDPRRWEAAAHASGQSGTPFHAFAWLELAARMTRTSATPLVVRAGRADVGVVPWLTRRRGPVTTVNWLPFPYVGPLVAPAHLPGLLRALRARARSSRAVLAQFGFPPSAGVAVDTARGAGFRVREDATYVVDTSAGVDRLWAALDGRARTKVRRAERAGVVLTPARGRERVLRRVVDEAFAARGLTSGYTGDFPLTVADLESTGLAVRWTVARLGDDEVGSLVTLGWGTTGVVWQGGVLRAHRPTHANTLLYWDGIRWAGERGLRTLDLVGVPDEGIGRFKSQFGGVRRTHPVLQRSAPGWPVLQRLAARVSTVRVAAARRTAGGRPTGDPCSS
ncbi:GNAT family N-acetyltransferase [Geodermatophilus sp. URMC 62]|uniref:GNAT family N-acetyltransferase n=1 Tax=Geodermatophilus sp. URMC 62 TaxID=3423414 RepID=UPI00406C282C